MAKTIFAVIVGSNTATIPALEEAIKRVYPNDHIALGKGEFLVADEGTSQIVSNKLGVTGIEPPPISSALIVAMSGYFGRQPTPVWEWIRSKWGGA